MSPRHQPNDAEQPTTGRPRPPVRPRPRRIAALVGIAVAGIAAAFSAVWLLWPASTGPGPAGPYPSAGAPTTPAGTGPASTAPTPIASAPATPTVSASPGAAGKQPEPEPRPARRKCRGHPTPKCTGVPPGTRLVRLPLNLDGAAYRVTRPGTVLDGVHIPGDLLINADDVVIRNSRIEGSLSNEHKLRRYSFTITDSTVGPAKGCITAPGIGEARFTALRVHIRGHGDGFHASGDDITIKDSYVRLCSNPGDHSDGIQTYLTGKGLVFDHNTVDQRFAKDITAPIFITDEQAEDVIVTRNLVMGGTYSIQVKNVSGKAVVRDNRLVDGSWVYGPVEADCHNIDWSGNTLVRIDDDYRITRTVGPLPCAT